MSKYTGVERRKHPRMTANFVISYRIKQDSTNSDLSQSRNVSQSGMLLTTNRHFSKGTNLLMTIRFPFLPKKIKIEGEVVNSKEVVKGIIYNTNIKFFGLEEAIAKELASFIKKRVEKKNG